MLRRLLTLEGENCRLIFELDKQDTTLTGYIATDGEPWAFNTSLDEIVELLCAKKLVAPDIESIKALLAAAAVKNSAGRQLIATGLEPCAAIDGRIEFIIRPFNIGHSYCEQDNGDIDFHQAAEICTAMPGEHVATIVAPVAGVAGQTVTGEPIRVNEPKKVDIRLGDGIKRDDNRLVATTEGRVLFESGTVSVTEEFTVQGNVGFNTGNIKFKGRVIVQGDVADGFTVSAQKGVTVHGVIGAAQIYTDGSIESQGIAGQGKARLVAGGDILTHYISGADVTCRNLDVENEIYNSTVCASGRVRVSRGAIIGGQTIALGGIDTKNAGSEAGIKTLLSAGISSQRLDEIIALKQETGKLEQLRMLTSDGQLISDYSEQLRALQLRVKNMQNEKEAGSVTSIVIRGRLMDNVTVYLEPLKKILGKAEGPLALSLSSDNRQIVFSDCIG